MRSLKIALIGICLFSLTGCANSRLRKDFVALFESNYPRRQSPFAEKCDQAGNKVADGVNKVGSKFDDCPIQERSGAAKDQVKNNAENAADKSKGAAEDIKSDAKQAGREVGDDLKGAKDSIKKEAKHCWDWFKN